MEGQGLQNCHNIPTIVGPLGPDRHKTLTSLIIHCPQDTDDLYVSESDIT
jgi:hypothetical protein